MFEKNKIVQTYTNKPTTAILCPTCNIPMLQVGQSIAVVAFIGFVVVVVVR